MIRAGTNQGKRMKLLIVAAVVVLLLMAAVNQIVAWRRTSLKTVPYVVNGVPARIYAEAHWNAILLGNREPFLGGFTIDALLVVVDEEGNEVVLKGIEKIGAAWDSDLLPFRSIDAVSEINQRSEEGRRAEAEILIRSAAPEGPIISINAKLRLDGNGRIFEERLEILERTSTLEQN